MYRSHLLVEGELLFADLLGGVRNGELKSTFNFAVCIP